MDQIITEPTHHTENSDSIIDLFLVSNKNRVLLSGVGEPFLDQNIRYHSTIYCVYNFDKIITPSFSRHIYLYHRGDFQPLFHELTETDLSLCDPSWLTNTIKRPNRLYDKYKRSKNQIDFNNYKQVRNDVPFQIRKAKYEEIDKLKNELKDPNICQNDWWKNLKYFIKPNQDSCIQPLKSNDIIYCKDEHKADKLNDFFLHNKLFWTNIMPRCFEEE